MGAGDLTMSTPAETFADRAPLLDDIDVANVVLFDLLEPAVRERVDHVYVYGSFVDADRELDRDGDVSDLDVYAVVDEGALDTWGVDGTEVPTRFSASQHGLLCRCATQGALDVYGRREPFDVPLGVDDSALVESLTRAERAVFHARALDTELLHFRALDLALGTSGTFERFLGDDPRLEVWPLDG